MNIFYSDIEPLSQYFPVMLHLSPATRILNENPAGKILEGVSSKYKIASASTSILAERRKEAGFANTPNLAYFTPKLFK